MDPFLRTPAMHTGLDFRGSTGDPVRATANGRVESAGVNGGYGKMIEIDHGNGFSTRYAHLSAIEVKVGQSVRIGQIIGRVGSTGRSTGPHLHYETRIDGEAVDPQKFLRAGLRLGSAIIGTYAPQLTQNAGGWADPDAERRHSPTRNDRLESQRRPRRGRSLRPKRSKTARTTS
jgi:hypothetical protein